MKVATIHSQCECQARLGAELDEQRQVLRGWAKDIRRRAEHPAPAHAIHPEQERFDVAWFCPFCIRNTLRSFTASGLAYREVAPAPSAAAPASGSAGVSGA